MSNDDKMVDIIIENIKLKYEKIEKRNKKIAALKKEIENGLKKINIFEV